MINQQNRLEIHVHEIGESISVHLSTLDLPEAIANA